MTTMQIGTCGTTQVLRLANTPQALARELARALTGALRESDITDEDSTCDAGADLNEVAAMSGKTVADLNKEAEGAATFAMGTELCTLPIRVVNGSALGEGMSLVDCIERYSPLTVHLGWDAFRLTQDADLAESSDYLVHLGIILFLHEDFRRRVRLFCQADTRLEGRPPQWKTEPTVSWRAPPGFYGDS